MCRLLQVLHPGHNVYIPLESSRVPFTANRRKRVLPAWSTVVTSRKNR
jgi:hypothetical protein